MIQPENIQEYQAGHGDMLYHMMEKPGARAPFMEGALFGLLEPIGRAFSHWKNRDSRNREFHHWGGKTRLLEENTNWSPWVGALKGPN